MLAWLRRAPVLDDGGVLSWVNAAHPGYPYPEAAGLLLQRLCREASPADREHRIAERLSGDVSPRGGLGRGGFEYPFDTAVALRGLLAFERAGGSPDPAVLERLFGFVAACIEERRAVVPGAPEPRWSTTWSPHLLKLVIVVTEWKRRTDDPRCEALAARLFDDLAPAALEWLGDPAGGPPRYVHAVCYAAEALVHESARGITGAQEGAARAAAWLAALQGERGALPAWSHPGVEPRLATDATAQAIGIWRAVDAARYAGNVERAWEHLAAVQNDAGGLAYAEGSGDVNTWCTVFALDAME